MTSTVSENTRPPALSDAQLLRSLHRAWQHAEAQQTRLVAAAPAITGSWLAEMGEELRAAEQSLASRRSVVTPEASEQPASLRLARAALQDLFYYVHKAYQPVPDEAKVRFGTEQYHAAAYHPARMQALLTQAFHAAGGPTDRAPLLAAGYQESALAELGALADSLAAIHSAPDLAETTQLLNRLWQRGCQLQVAAQQAFANEFEVRAPFELLTPDASAGA